MQIETILEDQSSYSTIAEQYSVGISLGSEGGIKGHSQLLCLLNDFYLLIHYLYNS